MRMQIPFSGLLMKQTPPHGDTHDGVFIPGGTRIAHNMLALQRDPDTFGADVELFRPERWLKIDPEQKARMISTVDLVFGYGRWGCAGKPVAFIELNKIYVEVSSQGQNDRSLPSRPADLCNASYSAALISRLLTPCVRGTVPIIICSSSRTCG